ncbi:MAG: family N-acetyltransferase [Naasia sp.]|nr:family N-acetyltransferase [Naasia sp.]
MTGAEREASAADARAGVPTRPASDAELGAAVDLSTWGAGRSPDRALLLAASAAGCPILLAVADGEPVGAAFAFAGTAEGLHWHSHMAAVAPARRGRGVGAALKLRQRALARAAGVPEIRWTYDPLLRRNATLNLVRLGAEARRLLPDFYGSLRDAVNGEDATDRLEVAWRLESERVADALAGRRREWSAADRLQLLADYETLRGADPAAAAVVRRAARAGPATPSRRAGARSWSATPTSSPRSPHDDAQQESPQMSIRAVELHRVAMPMVRPFETSFGRQTARDVLLVRVRTDDADGWGECVAMSEPVYSSE